MSVSALDPFTIDVDPPSSHTVGPMRDTGRDMKSKYKETSRGGLAVSVVEC